MRLKSCLLKIRCEMKLRPLKFSISESYKRAIHKMAKIFPPHHSEILSNKKQIQLRWKKEHKTGKETEVVLDGKLE